MCSLPTSSTTKKTGHTPIWSRSLPHTRDPPSTSETIMIKFALFARLEAKPGKEAAVREFLEMGLALANQESTTPIWFAPEALGEHLRRVRRIRERSRTAGTLGGADRPGFKDKGRRALRPPAEHRADRGTGTQKPD